MRKTIITVACLCIALVGYGSVEAKGKALGDAIKGVQKLFKSTKKTTKKEENPLGLTVPNVINPFSEKEEQEKPVDEKSESRAFTYLCKVYSHVYYEGTYPDPVTMHLLLKEVSEKDMSVVMETEQKLIETRNTLVTEAGMDEALADNALVSGFLAACIEDGFLEVVEGVAQ